MDNQYSEEREVLVPIGVSLKCAACNAGFLEAVNPSGSQTISSTLAVWPAPTPTYLHECTNPDCDNQGYFEQVYPTIQYDLMENHFESEA